MKTCAEHQAFAVKCGTCCALNGFLPTGVADGRGGVSVLLRYDASRDTRRGQAQ